MPGAHGRAEVPYSECWLVAAWYAQDVVEITRAAKGIIHVPKLFMLSHTVCRPRKITGGHHCRSRGASQLSMLRKREHSGDATMSPASSELRVVMCFLRPR